MAAEIIRFADFELDRATYQLRHQGRIVPIERVPLALLFLLAERPGQLLTRDEIYRRIWGKTVFVDPENAINTAIRKVRRALGDGARKPQFVVRVPGKGYRFDGRIHGENRGGTAAIWSTTLVGRNPEMAELRAALADAVSGRGRFLLISGEPGIGKSRICAELVADAERNGMEALIGHCVEQEAIPYLPFVEILESYADRASSLDELRQLVGEEGPELARFLPKLRRILPDLPRPPEFGAEQARRQLFNSVCDLIGRRCRQQPTLLILEDLQWADDSTLALISHLPQRLASLPLVVVGTLRASKADLNSGLTRALEGLVRGRLASEIRLKRLANGEVTLMLQSLSGQTPPVEVAKKFYALTDGNPFLVEEMFRHLTEENQLYDAAGHFRDQLEIEDTKVPRTVGMMVGRRLGRLHEATNNILYIASVIGRSFGFELLRASSGMQTESLLDCLDEAEQVGLVRSTSEFARTRTEFSHELIRQAVLSRLSASRRQKLHFEVAAAIERIYSDSLEDHYGALAQHYATDSRKAVRYLHLAGQQAMQRSAHAEAVRLLTSGLDLLNTLPETDDRHRQELESRIALGASLSASKSLAAPEVADNYLRAVQLSRVLGETQNIFLAQSLLAVSHYQRGEMQTSQELAKQLVELIEGTDDRTQLFLAHGLMGLSSFWLGHLALGHWHLENAAGFYDPQVDKATTPIFGYHAIVPCLSNAAWALWFMGYPLKALRRMQSAETLAQGFDHPDTQVIALVSAAWLHVLRREAQIVLERSELAIELANEHGFPYLALQAGIIRGWSLALTGHGPEGIAQMEAELAARKAGGVDHPPAQFLAWLAEAYAKNGDKTKSLSVLEEALARVDFAGDALYEAELYRLKGELLLMQEPSGARRAEDCFRIAIEKSAQQGAKSLELRAATSLSRLLARRRRAKEALSILTQIYGWFTEGFDTPDLRDAKVLLNELAS